jgi:ABC-type sugar transport system substrate-binding protein
LRNSRITIQGGHEEESSSRAGSGRRYFRPYAGCVRAICITPNDAKALEPAFAKAKAKGIIVITHESPDQRGKDYDIEMIDNVKFARHFRDELVKSMGTSGKYAITKANASSFGF